MLDARRPHERSIMIVLDMSKAFDKINHGILFQSIDQSTLPGHLKRQIVNYLQGRLAFVDFRDAKCKYLLLSIQLVSQEHTSTKQYKNGQL